MVSRVMVSVVWRISTSISPDCSAVKRCTAVSGTKRTLDGSPNMAAATPRQRSASMPRQTPWLSGSEKPAMPTLTPQFSVPRWRTASKACPACAAPEAAAPRPAATIAAAKKRRSFMEPPYAQAATIAAPAAGGDADRAALRSGYSVPPF